MFVRAASIKAFQAKYVTAPPESIARGHHCRKYFSQYKFYLSFSTYFFDIFSKILRVFCIMSY